METKAYLGQLVEQADDELSRARLVREYLQARILQYVQDRGMFLRWAFVGGTALRFLYGIPRFSEDLGFSAINPGEGAGLEGALSGARHALQAEGYLVNVTTTQQMAEGPQAVASGYVKFPGLLDLRFRPGDRTKAGRLRIKRNQFCVWRCHMQY